MPLRLGTTAIKIRLQDFEVFLSGTEVRIPVSAIDLAVLPANKRKEEREREGK